MSSIGFIKSNTKTEVKSKSILVPETFTHSIVFGQTGSGKTTSFIYPNLEERIAKGHSILLYDLKGREHLSVKYLAQKYDRLYDVVEIGKPWGESINLIEGMTEADLDEFLENSLGENAHNKFWTNSSKSVAQSVNKVLRVLEEFAETMEKVEIGYSQKAYLDKAKRYPLKMNLTNLVAICSSLSSFSKFTERLKYLPLFMKDLIKEKIVQHLDGDVDIEMVKPFFIELLNVHKRAEKVIEDVKDMMDGLSEESNEHLAQQFLGSLVGPLSLLSQNEYFNTNSFNIVNGLEEGKIIVINTEALSDAVLASLNSVILKDLTLRTRSRNKTPVSIFIDEAQRVLTKNADLAVDVLREAKVDLFLASQNSSLLIHKLGTEKFDAFMGNLTKKYYFQNSIAEDIPDPEILKSLECFEYMSYCDGYSQKQKSTPIFISDTQKLSAEYEYQHYYNVLNDFACDYVNREVVLEYIPKLFERGQIIVVDLKSMNETIISQKNFKHLSLLRNEVDMLFIDAAKQREQEYVFTRELAYDEEDFDFSLDEEFEVNCA